MKIKTIDVIAKEWYDRAEGATYFSARVVLDLGTPKEKIYKLPFDYGYGDHYIDQANRFLIESKIIPGERHENGSYPALHHFCKDNRIILRTVKIENCRKKEVENFGK